MNVFGIEVDVLGILELIVAVGGIAWLFGVGFEKGKAYATKK